MGSEEKSSRSVFDFSYLLRLVLSFLLFCLFVWQTAYSFNKYLDGATGTAFRRQNRGQMEFPSISLCSYNRILGSLAAIMGGATKMNASFAGDMEKRNRTEFVTYFTHLPHTAFKEFPSDYPEEEGTVGVWGSTFAISPYHTFVECATYTAGATFRPGYGSAMELMVHTAKAGLAVAFVHPPGKSVLVPTTVFGGAFVTLPDLKDEEAGYTQYQISTKEHNTLQKKTLPCHVNPPEKSMLDCLEDFFQVNASCSLPWIAKGEDQCKTIEDLREFKVFYDFLLGASEQDVYDHTGCYKACTYTTYELKKVVEEQQVMTMAPNFNLYVWFFLAPGGVLIESEILVYDMYDLIGNVGGFLGLFLGASILSMYDGVKENVQKLKYIVK